MFMRFLILKPAPLRDHPIKFALVDTTIFRFHAKLLGVVRESPLYFSMQDCWECPVKSTEF